MTTKTVSLSAYSIQAAKPNAAYGMLSVLPVQASKSAILLRGSLSGIPQVANLNSVKIRFWLQTKMPTTTVTLNIEQIMSAWSTSTHWANRPAYSATRDTVTAVNPAWGTLFEFDVTADAQSMISGGVKNQGWQITTSNSELVRLAGVWNAHNKPEMVIDYSMLPDAPDNLNPGAGSAVSVAAPTLTFTGADDMTALQIQVDPAMNATAPAFDSGTVAATAGQFALAGTTYAGLAEGATTYWRARQKNGYGWSTGGPNGDGWSAWYGFKRVAKGTVTIVNPPSGTVTDGSPPIEWTFSGNQIAWQVVLDDGVTGKRLADSGVNPDTATAWDPPAGLTKDGQTGTISAWIWDDQDRAATPGDPVYASGVRPITLNLDAGTPAVDTLAASNDGPSPDVTLTGTRAAGIPDEVAVFRNGVEAPSLRQPGTDVFSGTSYSIVDPYAPMNVPVTYRVAPVVNGKVAKGGPTVTITPTCQGIWLTAAADPTQRACISFDETNGYTNDQAQPELSIVHTPVAGQGGQVEVVRRRLNRMPPQGTLAGTVVDVPGQSAVASEAALRAWADPDQGDAGDLYRLVLGNLSTQVILGDINFSERSENYPNQRTFDVSLNWYGRA